MTFVFIVPVLAVLCSFALRQVLGRPRFLTGGGDAEQAASISIVIPARDEEETIGALLRSIAEQDLAPHEVIVVDDGSTDRTAEVARENGARVVDCPPLPEDWKGKPWACRNGAEAATGEWLLFLDADTGLEPGAMVRIAGLAGDPDTAYSVCPHHTIERPYEELSAFFNVVMLAGMNAFGSKSGHADDAGLFGQFLLISRESYDAVGGHEPVRGEVLENFHLAAHLAEQGVARTCFLGRGSVSMRMFPGGFRELWASWKKGFTTGAGQAAPRALFFTSLWITGAMFAIVGIILAATPLAEGCFRVVAALTYLLYVLQCIRAFRLAGTFSLLNALFFPVGLLFYQVLFFTALVERKRGIKTEWKGRHVD